MAEHADKNGTGFYVPAEANGRKGAIMSAKHAQAHKPMPPPSRHSRGVRSFDNNEFLKCNLTLNSKLS